LVCGEASVSFTDGWARLSRVARLSFKTWGLMVRDGHWLSAIQRPGRSL
jgi:hypothetical protein